MWGSALYWMKVEAFFCRVFRKIRAVLLETESLALTQLIKGLGENLDELHNQHHYRVSFLAIKCAYESPVDCLTHSD